MADGTYMGHGWCLIIAIDGQTGEVLDRLYFVKSVFRV